MSFFVNEKHIIYFGLISEEIVRFISNSYYKGIYKRFLIGKKNNCIIMVSNTYVEQKLLRLARVMFVVQCSHDIVHTYIDI